MYYFLIHSAQTKINLFSSTTGRVKENESFLLVGPCSRLIHCMETKLQFSFRKYISICTVYTVLIDLFRHFFTSCVELMVAATLAKNLLPPAPKWSNGQ